MSPVWRRTIVALILSGSLMLRAWMVAQGGQYFFGDEGRYDRGVQLYLAVSSGNSADVRALLALPEHAAFAVLGAGLTAGQHILAQLSPYGDWSHPENIVFTMWLGALLLSLFSTLNLWLIHRLARVAGADEQEALWVLVLAAASNTLFYPARHLLPYGCALTAALLALNVGLRASSPRRAFWCGVLAALIYHLYNGYWYLAPVIWLAHSWWWRREPRRVVRGVLFFLGLAVSGAIPLTVGALCGGRQYWHTMAAFSQSVTQGLFAEGWRLPWEFFWHAEGALGLAVVTAILVGLVRFRRSVPDRVRLWLLALVASYALLVLLSNALERFVVYARTVLPFTPLFCLLGGWAVAGLLARRGRLQLATALAVVLFAAWQLQPHFGRVFPREIEVAVLRAYGAPKHSLSVSGSLYIPLALPVTRPDLALVNAQLLYPIRGDLGYPAGQTLLLLPHPLAYPPFQYESHTPAERTFLRTHDISIRLIQLSNPGSVPADLNPALRFRTEERPTGHAR